MAKHILGISAYYHDSAACLVTDAAIVAAAQEERFTRKKHDAGFPAHAVACCLKQAGLTIADIDYVGFYEKPLVKFGRLIESYLAVAPRGLQSYLLALPQWLTTMMYAIVAKVVTPPRISMRTLEPCSRKWNRRSRKRIMRSYCSRTASACGPFALTHPPRFANLSSR